MPIKRKSGAPLKVPCPDEVYWKLRKEGAHNRMTTTEYALHCLKQATKDVKLGKKRPASAPESDV